MKPYYYVYRVSGSRGPVVKHATAEEAVAESHRLSAQHPGETFEILKCLAITRTTEPSTFWNDGESPAQPRYFNGAHVVWRVSPDNTVSIASVDEPRWDPSLCTLEDLLECSVDEITASELPHPIKP